MNCLEKKVCIVTGAGGGIGSSICKLFTQENPNVVIAVEHNSGSVDKWKDSCQNSQLIIPYALDITDERGIKTLVQTVKRKYGKIDVLVNAAGISFSERIGMINRSHVKQMFSVNVIGLIELSQYTARMMMRQGQGSIINIASVVGIHGNPGQSAYSATKGAIISFTKSAAKELASMGIRVNAVAPGLTDTEMIRQTSEDIIESRISRIGLGRIASPNEVAEMVLFLASEKASYITGQIISVDGGTIM